MFKNFEHSSSKKLTFARVNSRPPRMPSWMASSAAIDTAIGAESLRPPRIPSELSEPPSVSRPSELEASEGWSDSGSLDAAEAMNSGETSGRGSDTFVEELVPRTEEEAIRAIGDAVERFTQARATVLKDSEAQLVELVSAITRRVVAREVSLDPSIVKGLVREGINALGQKDRVVVRIGHFFAPMIDELREELLASGMRSEVTIDEALGETGCFIETDLGHVDESIEARLSSLLNVMTKGSVS